MKVGFLPIVAALLGLFAPGTGLAAIVIKTQPASLTANAGSTAKFTVAATSSAKITYQWQVNGTNIAKATNATLFLDNLQTNQTGAYTVALASGALKTNSVAATLTVLQGTIVRFALANGNVDVQLFDHDKPLTVQNFLHYVNSGLYSNTFFHRLAANFVLQGGGYSVSNRANALLKVTNIVSVTDGASATGEYFPTYLHNEYGDGPVVSNTFGTLAMARQVASNGGIYTNSANSQWYFNLSNNVSLNSISGGFTVFGRVVSGSNNLAAFNALPLKNRIVNYYTLSGSDTNATAFTSLPIVTAKTTAISNSDLLFLNMSTLSGGEQDTNPPTVTITYPSAGAVLTNGNIAFRGAAADDRAVDSFYIYAVRAPAFTNESIVYYYYSGDTTGFLITNVDARRSVVYATPVSYNLIAGNYVLLVYAVDAWGNFSTNDTATMSDGSTANSGAHINFSISTSLAIQAGTGGTVSPTCKGVYTNLAAPITAAATPKIGYLFKQWTANWTNSGTRVTNYYTANPVTVPMHQDMTLTASFVSYASTFTGLFIPTNGVSLTNSGFVSLVPTTSGAYSGKLLLPTMTNQFSGKFDATGASHTNFAWGKAANAAGLSLNIFMTNGVPIITGTLTNAGWTAPLAAYPAAATLPTNAVAGKYYVVNLPGELGETNQPEGDGYLTIKITSPATVATSGKLADGTVIQPSASLSQFGTWPLYLPLYAGKGVLIGWQSADTNNPGGTLQWIRSSGGAYPAGFSMPLQVTGSLLALPQTNTTYKATLDGGPLDTPVTAPLTVNKSRAFVVGTPDSGQLTLSLATNTGLFTGKYTPTGQKAAGIYGAFASPTNGGFGYFTNAAGISGRIIIEKQ